MVVSVFSPVDEEGSIKTAIPRTSMFRAVLSAEGRRANVHASNGDVDLRNSKLLPTKGSNRAGEATVRPGQIPVEQAFVVFVLTLRMCPARNSTGMNCNNCFLGSNQSILLYKTQEIMS
jgi:hypothetical protein